MCRDRGFDSTLFEKMEVCIKKLQIQIKSLMSSKKAYHEIIRLLYQYRHLNLVDLADLSSTDLIIHRIKLISEIKSHSIEQRQ